MKTVTGKKLYRNTAIAAIAALSLVITACGSSDDADDTGQDKNVSITIGVDGNVLGAQAWVAKEKGYFQEHGVDVTPTIFQSGADAVRSLAGQQVDLALALDFAAVSSLSDGLRLLGTVASPGAGFYHLMVQDKINSVADLTGATFGYNLGTAGEYVARQFLKVNGMSEDDVEFVALGADSDLVTALKTGDIDAAWVAPAGRKALETDTSVKDLTDDSSVSSTQGIYLVGNTDWVADNTDVIEDVIKAFAQASDDINADPAAAAKIIATAVNGDVGSIEAVLPGQGYGIGFTQDNFDRLSTVQQFLVDSEKITASKPIENYLDLTAMKAAFPDKVTMEN